MKKYFKYEQNGEVYICLLNFMSSHIFDWLWQLLLKVLCYSYFARDSTGFYGFREVGFEAKATFDDMFANFKDNTQNFVEMYFIIDEIEYFVKASFKSRFMGLQRKENIIKWLNRI